MSILISGSLAFDEIWYVNDQEEFNSQLAHQSSWSFVATDRTERFGGCAGNIAAALSQLGFETDLIACVGKDFTPYRERLQQLGIGLSQVSTLNDMPSARCCIVEFDKQKHLAIFLPGAATQSHRNAYTGSATHQLGVVLPETRGAMMRRLEELSSRNIKIVFSPSQAVSQLQDRDARLIIESSALIVLNSDEWTDLTRIVHASKSDLVSEGVDCIETRGAYGSKVFEQNGTTNIAPIKQNKIIDSTGCGDAFLAGVCAGITKEDDLVAAATLGSTLAAINLSHHGCQDYIASEAFILLAENYFKSHETFRQQ